MLTVLITGATSTAVAQTYSLFGFVTETGGTALEGAAIYVTKSTQLDGKRAVFTSANAIKVETDQNGRFEVESLKPGVYTVVSYYAGMKIKTKQIEVSDSDLRVDFRLSLMEGELGEIVVGDFREGSFGITRLRAVEGVQINDAKKNEVILVEGLTANLATNNSRQIYAKIPGLNIWESDGVGVQLGIGGRGLSPNRNSNFNTRQNGYDISADALGYPESYYTPPVRALKRIEIIRGAASLQYGTQFGGLLNFVFKEGPENRVLEVNSVQSVGSYGLFSSFNSLGGSLGNTRYYTFYQYKRSNGWRPNSELDQHTGYASLQYEITPEFSIQPQYTHMHYLAHQPGGLTDAQFQADPSQSTRERNWFKVNWNLFALKVDYNFSGRTALNSRFFGLVAGRDAVGNLGRIDRLDVGGNRDLLKDDFRNWGNETRLIHRYPLLENISVFLVGTRYYNGFTHRRQGEGSDGKGPDFRYLNPHNLEGSDFDLPSRNASVFVENIFNVTPSLSITPGVRFEYIRTEAEGYYRTITKDLAGNVLTDERIGEQKSKERSFILFGLGVSYKSDNAFEAYANYSQNYRAINFNDIRVNVGSLEVDPNISDERGFNMDLGIRGQLSQLLNYDIGAFHLSYQDRIGTVLRTEPNPAFNNLVDRTFRFRTNIADARIFGFESYAEVDLYKLLIDRSSPVRLSLFSNLALISAKYVRSQESGIEGNEVELVPDITFKTGLTFSTDKFEASYQFSYTSEHFSDASNAIRTPSAIEGVIPAYHVMDLSIGYKIGRYSLEAGLNNLTNRHYFTRRATGYPGPGIIPSNSRSFYVTVAVTL